MISRFDNNKSRLRQAHLKWWLLYLLVTIIMNFMMYGNPNIWRIAILIMPLAGSFYLIEWLLRQYRSRTHYALIMVLLTFLYFLGISFLIWLLVYELLPRAGVVLYDPTVPFHVRWFLGNMYRNFSPILVAAMAYRMFLAYKEQQQGLLAAEQHLNATLKQKLAIEEENKKLRKTLLHGQLGSHLKHNVINMLRQRLANMPEIQQLMEGMLAMQRYDYTHIDPQSEGILLENEVHYIQQLVSLNRTLYPDVPPVDFSIKGILIARLIPPFILSTILENAIKYGDQRDPQHPIRMILESSPQVLKLWATNKVKASATFPLQQRLPSSGIGLDNIRRQLELFCPGNFDFEAGRQGMEYQVKLTIHYH